MSEASCHEKSMLPYQCQMSGRGKERVKLPRRRVSEWAESVGDETLALAAGASAPSPTPTPTPSHLVPSSLFEIRSGRPGQPPRSQPSPCDHPRMTFDTDGVMYPSRGWPRLHDSVVSGDHRSRLRNGSRKSETSIFWRNATLPRRHSTQ